MPRADLTLTVPEDVWIGRLSRAYPEATIEVLAALSGDDVGVGLVEIVGERAEVVLADLRTESEVTSLEVLHRGEERVLCQFETDDPFLLMPARDSGVPLETPFDLQDGEMRWEVTAPHDQLSALGEELESFGIPFEVDRIAPNRGSEKLLTDRQRELLATAVAKGYYDTPRRCSLTDLADAAGIAKSTCSETLHRAEEAVIKGYIGESPEASVSAASK